MRSRRREKCVSGSGRVKIAATVARGFRTTRRRRRRERVEVASGGVF
jgi:hypothetical protein